ncbi:hypothetical protein E2C01_097411 [Portunus trituberculatus]|uniref:Uncharacterized protein n=1 Tax=Portunus trituberculatus TaxID=210409 RepID=A0A5B7K4S0_PORTR|nr:hypothetical protein [Portunus trituberculatus]
MALNQLEVLTSLMKKINYCECFSRKWPLAVVSHRMIFGVRAEWLSPIAGCITGYQVVRYRSSGPRNADSQYLYLSAFSLLRTCGPPNEVPRSEVLESFQKCGNNRYGKENL